jgi:hypothetical protein
LHSALARTGPNVLETIPGLPDPYWLITFFAFITIIPVNNVAYKINKKMVEGFINNSKFKGWNWVALLIGGPVFLFVVFGTILLEP